MVATKWTKSLLFQSALRAMFINVILPVFYEEAQSAAITERLYAFSKSCDLGPFEIVISDNGSTDGTLEPASKLARKFGNVQTVRLNEDGRGRAIMAAWRSRTGLGRKLGYSPVHLLKVCRRGRIT